MALPKFYDWERIRIALRQLDESFPGLLQNVVLIGGGAAWFYHENLRLWNDSDFPIRYENPIEEEIWLSKVVDFMGLSVAEATEILKTPWDDATHTFHYAGLEVDFLEEGLIMFPRDAMRSTRIVELPDVTFNIVEAALLYAEKCVLLKNKARPQDKVHHALLAQFLRCEFCRQAENSVGLRPTRWITRARDVKTADENFFMADSRFNQRLIKAIAALTERDHRALKHWAKHQLPGDTE